MNMHRFIYVYRVILMSLTTVGAAKSRALLQAANVRVLLVEEAGEVTRRYVYLSIYIYICI